MNRTWITLVVIGVVAVVVLVGWDILLTVTGNKNDFGYNIVPINEGLYSQNLEEHLVNDRDYYIYLQQANPAAKDESGTDVNLNSSGTGATTP